MDAILLAAPHVSTPNIYLLMFPSRKQNYVTKRTLLADSKSSMIPFKFESYLCFVPKIGELLFFYVFLIAFRRRKCIF